jgi:phosphoribosylanthranilate isomerase
MSSELIILPAVDLKGGQAVQLVQGVADTAKQFGDPITAALRWQELGAEWLHLVDLDAAFGNGNNVTVAAEVIAATNLKVELSGGIRDDASLERAFSSGCTRVNIGTAALENPQWARKVIGEYGEKIAIALDVAGEQLAARGWTELRGNVFEALDYFDNCSRFVVTDTALDGMLQGPNIELLERIARYSEAKIIASGGITNLEHIAELADLTEIGIEGAIVGTALYLGKLDLSTALTYVKRVAAL